MTWGDYKGTKEGDFVTAWQRVPWQEEVPITFGSKEGTLPAFPVPNSDGLEIVVSIRNVKTKDNSGPTLVPAGTRAVSVFLVNRRAPSPDERQDESMAFQAKLFLHADAPLVPRPNLQGFESDDWDERVGDLQYRDAGEFVVGHGVSGHAICQEDQTCLDAETSWVPSAYVEKVEASPAPGVELSMEALAGIQSAQEAQTKLASLKALYVDWIDKQEIPPEPNRAEVAQELMQKARFAANRIRRPSTDGSRRIGSSWSWTERKRRGRSA